MPLCTGVGGAATGARSASRRRGYCSSHCSCVRACPTPQPARTPDLAGPCAVSWMGWTTPCTTCCCAAPPWWSRWAVSAPRAAWRCARVARPPSSAACWPGTPGGSRRAAGALWRELISGMTAMQGPCCSRSASPTRRARYIAAAREHFGALTPLRIHRTPAQAIGEVSAGAATAAVLPLPAEDEPAAAAWWTALLHKDDPRIHVVARLPFWAPRPEGAPELSGAGRLGAPPDPSGATAPCWGSRWHGAEPGAAGPACWPRPGSTPATTCCGATPAPAAPASGRRRGLRARTTIRGWPRWPPRCARRSCWAPMPSRSEDPTCHDRARARIPRS